jgi:hypothetical protein
MTFLPCTPNSDVIEFYSVLSAAGGAESGNWRNGIELNMLRV